MRFFALFFAASLVAQNITTNPASLVQTFQVDGAPLTTSVMILGSGSVQLTSATQSGGNWLSVAPLQGTVPLTASVTIDPSGLPDGTYLGTVTAGSGVLQVTILVGNPGPQLPANGIVNAASELGGPISPGEIIAIYGMNIGPEVPYGAQVWDGVAASKVAGARVWFGGLPAPILYASQNLITAVVPFGIAGQTSVQVQSENLVARTPPFSIAVAEATPALFTADSSGKGQVAAYNQDYSLNSPSNPATQGSVVFLYATGAGVLNRSVADGTIISSATPPGSALPITVSIGGRSATIVYAGAAPDLIAGALQINAQVPTGIASGSATVVVTVGTSSSPDGSTISVR
jgi:uncharacterized protein (TIGR03437 family)